MTVNSFVHYVHLNAQAQADVTWWYNFAQSWNGSSLLPASEPSQFVYSDTCGSWGCGATCNNQWFQVPWPAPLVSHTYRSQRAPPLFSQQPCGGLAGPVRGFAATRITPQSCTQLTRARQGTQSSYSHYASSPFSAFPSISQFQCTISKAFAIRQRRLVPQSPTTVLLSQPSGIPRSNSFQSHYWN